MSYTCYHLHLIEVSNATCELLQEDLTRALGAPSLDRAVVSSAANDEATRQRERPEAVQHAVLYCIDRYQIREPLRQTARAR